MYMHGYCKFANEFHFHGLDEAAEILNVLSDIFIITDSPGYGPRRHAQ